MNTVNSDGIPDIALTVIPLGGFAIGTALGALNFARWAGILLIGILGGFSVGVRVVLLKPGLLVSNYVVNWLVMVPFAILGLAAVLVKQRFGLVRPRVCYVSRGVGPDCMRTMSCAGYRLCCDWHVPCRLGCRPGFGEAVRDELCSPLPLRPQQLPLSCTYPLASPLLSRGRLLSVSRRTSSTAATTPRS